MKDWAGFLELARTLATSDGIAELRTALSRAYYSAYHDARKYMSEKDMSYVMSEREDEPHARVWKFFSTLSGPLKQVSTLGFGLRGKRNQADYRVYGGPLPHLKYEATDAVSKAGRILTLLDQARGRT